MKSIGEYLKIKPEYTREDLLNISRREVAIERVAFSSRRGTVDVIADPTLAPDEWYFYEGPFLRMIFFEDTYQYHGNGD